MTRKLAILISIIIILVALPAHAAWLTQISGTSVTLFSVSCIPETPRCWAVGALGTILKSENAGLTWTRQSQDVFPTLFDVQFVNENTGWAVGAGIIIKTSDGGVTWNIQWQDSTKDIKAAYFNNIYGWAVGSAGLILRTTDGGATWIQKTSGTTNDLTDVISFENVVQYVVGNGGLILKSIDQGTTWISQNSGTTNNLNSIDCALRTNCWVAGNEGSILKTTDGGTAWNSVASGISSGIYGIDLSSSDTATIVAAQGGIVRRTINGGVSWINMPPENAIATALRHIYVGRFSSSEYGGLAVGDGGIILREGPATVTPSLPDLHMSPIVRIPDTPRDGSPFTLRAGVQNLGTGVAGASILSARLDLGNNGHHIGTDPHGAFDETLPVRSIGSISVGGSSGIVEWSWSAWPSGGPQRIVLCADSTEAVAESDENNNCSVTVIVSEAAVIAPALPDLIVESVGFEPGLNTPNLIIGNQSTAESSNPIAPLVKLEWLTASNTVVGDTVSQGIVALAPNQKAPMAFNTARPPVGATRLRMTADSNNVISESNENNNIWAGDILLSDLIVQSATFSTESRIPTVIVRNQGSAPAFSRLPPATPRVLYQWLNSAGGVIGTGIEQAIPTGLAANSTYTLSGGTLSSPDGAVRLRVIVDPVNLMPELVGELNETNNIWEGPIPERGQVLPITPELRAEEQIIPNKPAEQHTEPPSSVVVPAPEKVVITPEAQTEMARAKEAERHLQIEKIKEGSSIMLLGVLKVVEEKQIVRDALKEQFADQRIEMITKTIISALTADKKQVVEDAMKAFIAYGAPTKADVLNAPLEKLGAGERAGVVNSFREAFGKLPETDNDWEDVMKIAIGRFPSQTNANREKEAEEAFKKIYLRAPLRTQSNDNACVTVIAYGLRPDKRNLNSEKIAVQTFKKIFKKVPLSASDWDTVRCIGYSGAKR